MKLNIIKINPTGNMTILVKNPVARAMQAKIAAQLMSYDSVYAEQVGYIEPATNKNAVARLQMMGGEFCANATLSLATYIVSQRKQPEGSVNKLILEVSGAQNLITCDITVQSNNYLGRINVPSPCDIHFIELTIMQVVTPIQKVELSGITHYIFQQEFINAVMNSRKAYASFMPKEDDSEMIARSKARFMLEYYAHSALQSILPQESGEAFGLLFFDKSTNHMTPLIYVKSTHTLIWEKSCISGTAALAYAHIAQQTQNSSRDEIAYIQPGGTVFAEITASKEVYIRASLQIVMEGVAYL